MEGKEDNNKLRCEINSIASQTFRMELVSPDRVRSEDRRSAAMTLHNENNSL